MSQRAPAIRESLAANGKPEATVAGLAYVAIGDDAEKALDEAAHHVLRYYGQLWTEPANLIHHGPPAKIAEEVAAYADTVDVLVLCRRSPISGRSSCSRSTFSPRTADGRLGDGRQPAGAASSGYSSCSRHHV
jgi:hypothetical protein